MEQATHPAVAAYHARRFPPDAPVTDLTAGIGADLIALSHRGPAVGYELDPLRAACAAHNAPTARVVRGDGLDDDPGPYAIADPARRHDGKRLRGLEGLEPDPFALRDRLATCRLGLMKLSPVTPDHELDSLSDAMEFVSYGRECREALLAFGSEAEPGVWAVHVESGERLPRGPFPSGADTPDTWLYDADPAAIRADALAAFGLSALGDSPGYLTGPHAIESVWLRRYRVIYSGKGDLKTTRAAAAGLDAHVYELKQRGAAMENAATLRAFRPGSRPVSLVAYRVGRSVRHLLTESA